jgi:hypothetical protein
MKAKWILFLCPAIALAGVVDLGVVEIATDSNAVIHELSAPGQLLTYTYQQQIFFGNLSMTFDGGQTLGQVLANDEGPQIQGTLDYNFPIASSGGASGNYDQNTIVTGLTQGTFLSFSSTIMSGTLYPGANSNGATVNLDPTNPLLTFSTILGGMSTANFQVGGEAVTETTVTLPFIGTITNGPNVTTYIGEGEFFDWTDIGTTAAPVPEPAAFVFGLLGGGALLIFRKVKS